MAIAPSTPATRKPTWGFIDLFSGCGGASAGFLATGLYAHIHAADNDQWANATYERNLGIVPEQLDLSLLSDPEARKEWAARLKIPSRTRVVLFGGPPCQGFSSHVKMRGDRHGRNDLFSTFGSLALQVRPDVVMIENVGDLVAKRSWGLFDDLRSRLVDAGYAVRARIVNMAELGVPQERFRTVVLASRTMEPTFPAPVITDPAQFSTVKDWIGDLPPVDSGEGDALDPMHEASHHRASTLAIIRQVPHDGGSRPAGVGPECLQRARDSYGGYTDVYGRLAWSDTAPTITARCRTPSCGRFIHPEQDRGLTAREAALLQTFPRDWHLCGPFDDRYKQVGNAVPPLAARVFAEHIGSGFPSVANEIGVFEVEDKPVGASFSVLIPGIRKRGGVL
jgi:DNA (cytosine-5)-methyltransferase 1